MAAGLSRRTATQISLLTYGPSTDWIVFNAVIRLNFFLKEDERVKVEAAIVDDAWKATVRWNMSLVQSRSQEFNLRLTWRIITTCWRRLSQLDPINPGGH